MDLFSVLIGDRSRYLKAGEGDCDSDLECNIGLRCGMNNCKTEFSTNETKWNRFDDCCTGLNIPYHL